MDREVFVYIDLLGEPIFVGRVWSRIRKGRESATFEYDPSWLAHLTSAVLRVISPESCLKTWG